MKVGFWFRTYWRVMVGTLIAVFAWVLFSYGVVSAEEAITVALFGGGFGGFAQVLLAHRREIALALDAQKQWHVDRAKAHAELLEASTSVLMAAAPAEPMVPLSHVAIAVGDALRQQQQIHALQTGAGTSGN